MSKYVSYAAGQAGELEESLSIEEIEALKADLEQMGLDAWVQWAGEAISEANDFLRATEKQRARKKRWSDPMLRRRLILCAYHQARIASAMVEAASWLGPGGGYRDTAASAAMTFFQIQEQAYWRWPFVDVDPPEGWPGLPMEPSVTCYRTLNDPSKNEIRYNYT